MGCQALAYADIWGDADWYEGDDDDGAKKKITIGMYAGLRKPKFISVSMPIPRRTLRWRLI